jgi:hypothetical protein
LAGATLAVSAALTGCGSSGGYMSTAQTAVSSMRDAIKSYNSANRGSVSATSHACKQAADKLRGTSLPTSKDAPAKKRALAVAISRAYHLALRGLDDCAAGGSKDQYLLMAKGAQEIEQANSAIATARRLDH